MKYGQIVMGPAGSGKSTYCSTVVKHCHASRRAVYVVNLDPAAEHFDYPVHVDVRELIHIDDVMEDEDIKLGPNGGLIFCLEYLVQNLDWLQEQIGDGGDDDYYIFDCPGQIELYTHLPVMKQIVDRLQKWDFRLCGVFLLDSQFLIEASKFFAGSMTALSAMVTLELPHVNVLSKMDLLDENDRKEVDRYLDPDPTSLLADLNTSMSKKYHKLNKAIATILSDYGLVQFMPLDINDEDNIGNILLYVDSAIQYGEDLEVHVPKLEADDDGDDT
ncbi:GPN-loop GTPase 3-like [Halichondria panicea]|uniref:GPN-loop GTPase 3-like n=1 Tax=Halichondria panicea TaxID=6063 RepID=UPI00312B7705